MSICVGYKGEAIWCLPSDTILPRIGDTIHYYFDVAGAYLKEYADHAIASNQELHGTAWKVVSVEHHIMETGIGKSNLSTWVMVKPLKRKKK